MVCNGYKNSTCFEDQTKVKMWIWISLSIYIYGLNSRDFWDEDYHSKHDKNWGVFPPQSLGSLVHYRPHFLMIFSEFWALYYFLTTKPTSDSCSFKKYVIFVSCWYPKVFLIKTNFVREKKQNVRVHWIFTEKSPVD